MNIRVSICPRCGEPSDEGLCGNCRLHETEWVSISDRVTAILCPTCGSRKVGSSWSDCTEDWDSLGRSLVLEGTRLHPDLRHPVFRIEFLHLTINRSQADVTISGECFGIPVESRHQVMIAWGKEQCDRCCRISGSYYEGIIQVRGEGRLPTSREIRKSAEIAYQAEDTAQQGGDRLSFVSSVETSKDGVDIIVSSVAIGQTIVHDISSYFNTKSTSHPKLVGEKDGKKLYRVTWLVRLPRIVRGDVVEIAGHYYQVIGSDSKTIRTVDLHTRAQRSFRDIETIRIVGNIHDSEEAIVTHREGDALGILDPKTQIPQLVLAPDGCSTGAGGSVAVVRDGERLVMVGS
ncbi:MAG: NMD protein affecting ribosome stability and mRNA decay [Methanocalculus sp. MSAO_Arc2]|uniref:60S ribosomal export protein NMD3 n=1 Tax=Methanocalculus sp. MSAO_Arc2 TaxID=2293855 RepID=UPI000FEFD660|nr:MAG: NMD protein affecting ribosome stability and mRNA decay [Methanocalculus sp. MSAO_Arc2]